MNSNAKFCIGQGKKLSEQLYQKPTFSIHLKLFQYKLLKDYIILGPLGRGAASFVYKIQSRKDQKELVFLKLKKCNKFNSRL